MNSLYVYFIAICILFPVSFHILFKMKFQEIFKANNIWEIKVAFVLLSICISHLLATFVEKLFLISTSF